MLYTIGDAQLTRGESLVEVARALSATVIDVRLYPAPNASLGQESLAAALGGDYRSWTQRLRETRTRKPLYDLVNDLFETLASIREDQHVLLLGGPTRPELCARSWFAAQYELIARMLMARGHLDEESSEEPGDAELDIDGDDRALFRLLPETAHIIASGDESLELLIGQRPARYPTTEDELEVIDVSVAFDPFLALLRRKMHPNDAVEQLFDEESAGAFRQGEYWVFHDDELVEQHAFFQGWRRTHPKGFVATFKSAKKATLHRTTGCHHMGDTEWMPEHTANADREDASLTEAKKVCADERAHIDAFAQSNGVALTECAHCFGKR